VIDLPFVREEALPPNLAVSTITLAELSAGPHATDDPGERAARQHRLQQAEATFDAIPFDEEAARAYGRVYAAVVAGGKKARGRRALDLMIAATAVASDLPLYTRNPDDFAGRIGRASSIVDGWTACEARREVEGPLPSNGAA